MDEFNRTNLNPTEDNGNPVDGYRAQAAQSQTEAAQVQTAQTAQAQTAQAQAAQDLGASAEQGQTVQAQEQEQAKVQAGHAPTAEAPATEQETQAQAQTAQSQTTQAAQAQTVQASGASAEQASVGGTANQGFAPQGSFTQAQQGSSYVPPYAQAGGQGTGFDGMRQNFAAGSGPNYTVNASGEYRYIPPYSPAGAHNPNPQAQPRYAAPTAYQKVPDKAGKKKEKTKKSFSAGAVALIVAACILLSFGAGMGGSILANKLGYGTSSEKDGSMVVYKNPEKDDSGKNSADTGKDGTAASSGDGLALSDICAKVTESVVEIETEFKSTYGFYQYVSDGAGSGVIISSDGYVITNNHVIYNSQSNKVADSVTVRLSDSKEYKATVVGRDSDADIALLKVDATDLTPAVVGDSASLRVGESVIAVGNPLGKLGGTVTSGIISATNREITVENNKMNLIQMDAAINPGNSGGGMFNMNGELVGIVNAKSSGSDIDGLGFAIPVNDAMTVVEELQAHGYVTGKTYIGVSLVDVTDSYTAYYYFRSQQTGVYIAQVEDGFNSKVLKYGDRIISIDGQEVSSSEDVKSAVKSHSVGDEMKFSVSREGKIIDVKVKCYEYVPGSDVTFDSGTAQSE